MNITRSILAPKTILALVLGASTALATIGVTAANHRDGAGAERWIEQRAERMSERLGMSETQRGELEALMREQAEAHRAMRESNRARLDALLTEEQRTQLEQMQAERREHRQARARDGKRGGGKHHRHGDCGPAASEGAASS